MSATMTITQPANYVTLLFQENHFRSIASDAIDRLGDILFNFKDSEDPLSFDIFRWGVSVISAAKNNQGGLIDAQQKIQTLVHEILIDPSNGSELENPSHPFARDVLQWVKSLPDEITKGAFSQALTKGTQSQSHALPFEMQMMQMLVLSRLQSNEKGIEREVEFQKELAVLSQGYELARQATVKRLEEDGAKIVGSAMAHAESTTAQIARIEHTYQSATKIQEERIETAAAEQTRKLAEQVDITNATVAKVERESKEKERISNGNVVVLSTRLGAAGQQIQSLQSVAASHAQEIARVKQMLEQSRCELEEVRSNSKKGGCVIC